MKVVALEPDREYSTEAHKHIVILVDPNTGEPFDNMEYLGCPTEAVAVAKAWEAMDRFDSLNLEGGVWVVALPEWVVIAEFQTVHTVGRSC